jgi:OOP family OmpA-OmpF porin
VNVWIEQSPHAILAYVIRGIAPESLRSAFRETLENIQLEKSDALTSFTGDTAPFESTEVQLKECLQAQYKPKKRKISIRTWIFLGIVALLLGAWIFISTRDRIRWNKYIQTLRDTPGIVITNVDKRAGGYHIAGLLDPLAPAPEEILEQTKLSDDDLVFQWEPYYSMHPDLMGKRINKILNPPESTTLHFNGETLRAEGTAPHAWIMKAREQVQLLPWALQYNDAGLTNEEMMEIERISTNIGQRFLLYETNSSRVPGNQVETLNKLHEDLVSLIALAQQMELNIHIQIRGYADSYGTEQANLRLSQRRADNLLDYFITQGLNANAFSTIGLGEQEPEDDTIKSRTGGINRCVTFKVMVDEKKKELIG